MPPVVSIVIPAHNEEALLGRTLEALRTALAGIGDASEIVVVDDSSTDRTAEIAGAHGARVVRAEVHQIAAARNAGARAAAGGYLVFVDADTIVPPDVLRAAIEAMHGGAAGGGSSAVFEPAAPRWAHRAIAMAAWLMRIAQWAPGCFIFAERRAFEQAGGFDERYFASEEIHLSRVLKRIGPFVLLRGPVVTSARKAEHYSMSHTFWLMLRMLWPGSLKRREGLEFWYTRHHKSNKP